MTKRYHVLPDPYCQAWDVYDKRPSDDATDAMRVAWFASRSHADRFCAELNREEEARSQSVYTLTKDESDAIRDHIASHGRMWKSRLVIEPQHKDAIPPPAYTFIEESAPFDAALSEALDAVIAPLRVRPDAFAGYFAPLPTSNPPPPNGQRWTVMPPDTCMDCGAPRSRITTDADGWSVEYRCGSYENWNEADRTRGGFGCFASQVPKGPVKIDNIVGKLQTQAMDEIDRMIDSPAPPTAKLKRLMAQPPTDGERVRCCRAHADPCWMFNDEVWSKLPDDCGGHR